MRLGLAELAAGLRGLLGPPAGELRRLRGQVLAEPGEHVQDGLGQFREDVEPADLVRDGAEDLGDRLRIQRRAVGGDPADGHGRGP